MNRLETCSYRGRNEADRAGSVVSRERCTEPVWENSANDFCVLHAREDNKPIPKIQAALDSLGGDQQVTGAYLASIEDGSQLDFSEKNLIRADFSNSSLRGVSFSGGNFAGADFTNADLTNADFSSNSYLKEAVFVESKCNSTTFSGSNLNESDFEDANIVNSEFQHIDGRDIGFDSARIIDTELFQSNLNYAVFRGAYIQDVDFNRSHLQYSDFTKAEIFESDFTDANLTAARFHGSYLDEDTNFGHKLLLEYTADRKAEPSWIQDRLGILRVGDDFYGNPNKDSIPEEPPSSPYQSQQAKRRFRIYVWLMSIIRSFTRLSRSSSDNETGQRQLNPEGEKEKLKSAEKVYASLKSAFRDSARADQARRFNIREKEARRKRTYFSVEWGRLFLLRHWMKYGESPYQVVKVGIVSILVSVAVFLQSGVVLPSGEIIRWSLSGEFEPSILLRVSVFALRRLFTFSNGGLELVGWGSQVATVISAVGKLIEAALVFTLGRRAVS